MSKCKSWTGEFDALDNPIKNGRLYMPGERKCGFRDCVNPDHVDRPPVPEGSKECSVCGEARPIVQFGIDRKKPDGRNCECKPCRNKRHKKTKDFLDPATLTPEQLYKLQSDSWGQGYNAGNAGLLKAVETAAFLAARSERKIIAGLIERQICFDALADSNGRCGNHGGKCYELRLLLNSLDYGDQTND